MIYYTLKHFYFYKLLAFRFGELVEFYTITLKYELVPPKLDPLMSHTAALLASVISAAGNYPANMSVCNFVKMPSPIKTRQGKICIISNPTVTCTTVLMNCVPTLLKQLFMKL